MSYELTILSFKQTGLTSSEQHVLTVLSFRANDNLESWPSIKSICTDTKQNKKTVRGCLISLLNKKLITKTGEMKGRTRSVPVYKLNLSNPKIGLALKTSDPVFSISDPKIGSAKRSLKRYMELKDLNDQKNVLAHANSTQKPQLGIDMNYQEYVGHTKTQIMLGHLPENTSILNYQEWNVL